nr:Abi family protein [Magnetospira sp. QH-2]
MIRQNRKQVARCFGQDESVLVSWFRSLTTLRNNCAHHSRVWNARMEVNKPKTAKRIKEEFAIQDSVYARIVVLYELLYVVEQDTHWATRLKNLFDEHPKVPLGPMGFPDDWRRRAFWNRPTSRAA